MLSHPADAAPVFGKKLKFRQPDGQTVQVRVWGDEFHQIVESLDGYALVRDPATQVICYARHSADQRQLTSTGVRVGSRDPRSLGLNKHLRASRDVVLEQVTKAKAAYMTGATTGTPQAAGTTEPIVATTPTGNVQGICLIVDFSDDVGTILPSEVGGFCNTPGYTGFSNNGSVRDYFHDVSGGRVTYTNFVPPQYHRAAYPKTYYDDPATTYGVRARELIIEALNALDASGFDFSQYDADQDGKIDAINCFYAGTTTCGWAQGLWPHAGTLSFSADGVEAFRYQISDMGTHLRLDTFCHENGHMLCNWPDLYDYEYDSKGVGRFCLMCNMASETNPVQPCAYLKYIAGWTNTTLLVNHEVGLPLSSGSQNQVYKYPHPTKPGEYFLIENRQKTGRDQAIPDAGLALWHIDTNGSNNNQQQTPLLHYLVTLVQADGRWDLESNDNDGDSTDLWKAPTYTTCGPHTSPNTSWWDGTYSSLGISQISSSGPTMTFTFGAASILAEPLVIRRIIYPGSTVSDDTFTITNPSSIVPMSYTVNSGDYWLQVYPQQGTSQGDTDTITISYDNSAIPYWPPGTYGAWITVQAVGADNSPQMILAQLIIGAVAPDFDHDTDVDQVDFGHLQACLTGSNVRLSDPNCADADLDRDSDVDKYDLNILNGCFSGSDVQAMINCANFGP